jgi:hypothetical protein
MLWFTRSRSIWPIKRGRISLEAEQQAHSILEAANVGMDVPQRQVESSAITTHWRGPGGEGDEVGASGVELSKVPLEFRMLMAPVFDSRQLSGDCVNCDMRLMPSRNTFLL